MNVRTYYKFGKSLFSGGLTALVNIGLLYFFTEVLGVWYVWSSVLAFGIAILFNFSLQKFWVFRDVGRDNIPIQLSLFTFIALANLVVNTVLVYVLTENLHMWYLLSQVIVTLFLALVNYLLYRKVIFKTA